MGDVIRLAQVCLVAGDGDSDRPPFYVYGQDGEMRGISANSLYEYTLSSVGSGGLYIQRADQKVEGFLLNRGPGPVQISYWLVRDWTRVGPRYDYLQPGQFREVVAGPGVAWKVSAVF